MSFLNYILIVLLFCSLYVTWHVTQRLRSAMKARKKALRDARRLLSRGEEAQEQAIADKRRFLEALGEAFLLIGPQGHVILANSLAKELFREPKLEGRIVHSLNANPELLEHMRAAFESNTDLVQEFTLSAAASPPGERQGMTAWRLDCAIVDKPIREKRILLRNITQNYQINQMRRDFVANASHELRTPLTIIVGYLENLMEPGLIEEQPVMAHKFLEVMHQNSQRLMQIIEDMLMISKLESDHKSILKERWFDLADCVKDVFTRLDSIREKKHARLIREIPPGLRLYGDPFYWAQIFFNLVENALKHNTRDGLEIRVGATLTAKGVLLLVQDNGSGVPAESLPFLFNRFYRVEAPHAPKVKGTGLGLSIVKRAVEAHGGTIHAGAGAEQGTVFTVALPAERVRTVDAVEEPFVGDGEEREL